MADHIIVRIAPNMVKYSILLKRKKLRKENSITKRGS